MESQGLMFPAVGERREPVGRAERTAGGVPAAVARAAGRGRELPSELVGRPSIVGLAAVGSVKL